MLIRAGGDVKISNVSHAPARVFALFAASIEQQPSADADSNQPRIVAPGVVVSVAGQTRHFLLSGPCLNVAYGFAIMGPGERLPSRPVSGYELIIPTSGTIEVRSQNGDMLRTDPARQWQDELPFATIGPGVGVAVPPDSLPTYTVSDQEPASFWVFTVEASSDCSSPG